MFEFAATVLPKPPADGLPAYSLVSSSSLMVKKLLNLYQSPYLKVLFVSLYKDYVKLPSAELSYI